ncbi:MAG: radical SAM protein [Veillonellaceae bacterium]|nr:radical SAM protein [Veillonellaceae bacterium]
MSRQSTGKVLGWTESVCPVCLQRIPASRVQYGEDVYLEKFCEEHGPFRTVIWRGNSPSYTEWGETAHSIWQPPLGDSPSGRGCPFECGLCPDHRRQTCCVLLEVTGRCNLRCPVCFAQSGAGAPPDPTIREIGRWYEKLMAAGGPFNIQLSGGEPTVRDDLPDIVALGRSRGFPFIQVNTNGLRLAADSGYARRLKQAGLSCVFLQFDGMNDEIYHAIRGAGLLAEKQRAIECCSAVELGVILAVTVVPGINDGNLGEIVKFALERMPTVRGVHFQPVSYFGRYPQAPADKDRITLPEIMRAIELQTGGMIPAVSLHPPQAENAYCSFQGHYVRMPDGAMKVWNSPGERGCCGSAPPAEGTKRARDFVARKWSMPESKSSAGATDQTVAENTCDCELNTASFDEFLDRVERYSFCISGMAFQDAWTLDLERLRECFIHVVSPVGRIIPFCAYNLTANDGRSLYRLSLGTAQE